jgi:uncharacterized damage-inducible protein DinB
MNNRILHRQIDGLTHADSLVQPPVRGNCLNWILGHILVHRDYILDALGAEKLLDEKTTKRYDRESEPITEDGDDVVPFETLVALLDESLARISAALSGATAESLAADLPDGVMQTVGRTLDFLHWHETYHVGQTELLRQLAGKDDKVI